MVPKILIVGCGDLGSEVGSHLVQLGLETVGVRRSAVSLEGITIIQADVTEPASLKVLEEICPEVMLYCVAANGQTDAQYKSHYVDGLRHVLATQVNNLKLKHVFFVSSTRVYGQKTDALLDETVSAVPADFGGERLLEAENLLKSPACPFTILRLSGIYGPGRLRMISMAKSPETWPEKNSWSNRIHRDDAAAFIVFLIQKVLTTTLIENCYIVTDSRPTSQYEVLQWIAHKLESKINHTLSNSALLNNSLPITELHLNTARPIEGGKRLSNQLLLSSGFKLRYADYQAGYQALIDQLIIKSTNNISAFNQTIAR